MYRTLPTLSVATLGADLGKWMWALIDIGCEAPRHRVIDGGPR